MNKIGIVTCTYNSEKYINQMLESLIPYEDIIDKLVIVDAQSSDKTLQIVKSHKVYNLIETQIVVSVPLGVANAMNIGAKEIKSSHIAFLNSDDYLNYSKHLENFLIEILLKEEEKIYLFNCDYLTNNKLNRKIIKKENISFIKLFKKNRIFHPSSITSKVLFDMLKGFNENYKVSFDYDFWLRATYLYPYEICNLTLATFRVHNESISYKFRFRGVIENYLIRSSTSNSLRLKIYAILILFNDLIKVTIYTLYNKIKRMSSH